jgi:hypothetical protein
MPLVKNAEFGASVGLAVDAITSETSVESYRGLYPNLEVEPGERKSNKIWRYIREKSKFYT